MKNLLYFGALALAICLVIYSCKNGEITSNEPLSQKIEVKAKDGYSTTNAVGFSELDMPKKIGANFDEKNWFNTGAMTSFFDNQNNIYKDTIILESAAAACQMICQDSYRENVKNCDRFICRYREWRMYRKCVRGCR